ncbi:MAG: hypothetical protein ABEH43_09450 [Flavobacteriales bacterium]
MDCRKIKKKLENAKERLKLLNKPLRDAQKRSKNLRIELEKIKAKITLVQSRLSSWESNLMRLFEFMGNTPADLMQKDGKIKNMGWPFELYQAKQRLKTIKNMKKLDLKTWQNVVKRRRKEVNNQKRNISRLSGKAQKCK